MEINPDVIINKLLATIASNLVTRVLDTLREKLSNRAEQFEFTWKRELPAYLAAASARHDRVKTLLNRETAAELYDIYVDLDLQSGSANIHLASWTKLLSHGTKHIITATGGAGKSMLMRHLFLGSVATGNSLPIFFDLRNVNAGSTDIVDHLLLLLSQHKLELTRDQFQELLDKGLLAVFLDGFDEVDPELRQEVRMQIRLLTERSADTPVIVSSRPDDEFIGWSSFRQWTVQGLDKARAVALVEKLNFDKSTKDRFVGELRKRLYDQHASFASVPLLLTIMFLSHLSNADIPLKRHLFYAQAFEALWNRHDATKDGYKRHISCGLAMDDFIAVLCGTSMQMYVKNQTKATQSDLCLFIAKSAKLCDVTVNPEKFLWDLRESVCVYIQDGLELAYAHRSFLEYHAALFLTTRPSSITSKLWPHALRRFGQDDVLGLAHEMNTPIVEEAVLQPFMTRLLNELRLPINATSTECFLRVSEWAFDFFQCGPPHERVFVIRPNMHADFNVLVFICVEYSDKSKLDLQYVAVHDSVEESILVASEEMRFDKAKMEAVKRCFPFFPALFGRLISSAARLNQAVNDRGASADSAFS